MFGKRIADSLKIHLLSGLICLVSTFSMHASDLNLTQLRDSCREYMYANTGQAQDFAKQLLKKSQQETNPTMQSEAWLLLGVTHSVRKNAPEKILECYENGLTIAWEIKDSALIAKFYVNMANVHNELGNYSEAAVLLLNAENFSSDSQVLSAVYNSLGVTFGRIDNVEKQLFYHKKGLQIRLKAEDTISIAYSYNNVGTSYSSMEEYDSAIYYLDKALELQTRMQNSLGIAETYHNIALVKSGLEEHSEAIRYLKKAFKIDSTIQNISGMLYELNNIAEEYEKAGDVDQTHRYLLRAEAMVKQNNNHPEIERYIYNNLAESWIRKGDYEKALYCYRTYVEIKDSLLNQETLERINQLETIHQVKEKQQELEIERQRSALLEKDHEQFQWMVIGIACFGVLIIVLLVLWSNRQRIKIRSNELEIAHQELELERQREMLEQKDKDLTAFALNIVAKNDLIENLEGKITQVSQQKGFILAENLKALTAITKDKSVLDQDRRKLEEYIDETYQEFIRKLNDRFPEITDKEIRLASLLRLDLSSKEIATTLNIGSTSIDTYRSKLRKKFGLSKSDSLADFLKNL